MNYGGDVLPSKCWERLQTTPQSVLIDVRTQVEWNFIGLPFLDEVAGQFLVQEWQVFPQMAVDPEFANSLSKKIDDMGLGKDAELYFLCRSGVRSLAAARQMTAAGFINCYNVAGGFEGDLDPSNHRGNINGWKVAGLPWKQS